jgi:hypothetical protein
VLRGTDGSSMQSVAANRRDHLFHLTASTEENVVVIVIAGSRHVECNLRGIDKVANTNSSQPPLQRLAYAQRSGQISILLITLTLPQFFDANRSIGIVINERSQGS